MNINQSIVIISAALNGLTHKENISRDANLEIQLKRLNLAYKPVAGVYQGTKEPSFVVVVKDENDIEAIQSLANHYSQECYLYSDANRFTTLHYFDGRVEALGILTTVPKAVALTLDNYTADYENDTYYAIS